MHSAITRAHLAFRSQQSQIRRTPRDRRRVWPRESFRLLKVPLDGDSQLSLFARQTYSFRVGFMHSVERWFAAVTAIGFIVTVAGMILLQTI